MPSHPIATWITPCNSRNVQVLGTSTRRHTIGLIPSSPTLTCTISAASASAADEAVSTTGLVRFGARVTRPAYRQSPLPVAGTPDILMLSRYRGVHHRPRMHARRALPEQGRDLVRLHLAPTGRGQDQHATDPKAFCLGPELDNRPGSEDHPDRKSLIHKEC